jgi:hypothetical protein
MNQDAQRSEPPPSPAGYDRSNGLSPEERQFARVLGRRLAHLWGCESRRRKQARPDADSAALPPENDAAIPSESKARNKTATRRSAAPWMRAVSRLIIRHMKHAPSIQVGELCRRLDVPYRHARYVLEEGILPTGVAPEPQRGHHRQLTPAQAFWLGIVLKLKQSAIRTPLAAKIADEAKNALRGVARELNGTNRFSPFNGQLGTDSLWYVDVGDFQYLRIATDSYLDEDCLHEFPWRRINAPRRTVEVEPLILVRVDLAGIARRIHAAFPSDEEKSPLPSCPKPKDVLL